MQRANLRGKGPGWGRARAGMLAALLGLAVPAARRAAADLVVTSSGSNELLRYHRTTGALVQRFAAGPEVAGPRGLRIAPDGAACAAAAASARLLRFQPLTGALLGLFSPAGAGGLERPGYLEFGPDGNLYAPDEAADRILRFDGRTGAFLDVFVSAGAGGLDRPAGAAFGPDGHYYVASGNGNAVLRFHARTGEFLGRFVAAGSGGLLDPVMPLFGPDGNLYVSSRGSDAVLRFGGETGAFLDAFIPPGNSGLDGPAGLAFGPDGHLYACSELNDRVLRWDGATGAPLAPFVLPGIGGPAAPADLLFLPAAAAPGELGARAETSSSIRLTWRDNSLNETGFRVERREEGGFLAVASLPPDTTAFTDTGRPPGIPAVYRVRALAGSVASAATNLASATPVLPAPSHPAAAAPARGRVEVSWRDNSRDETGFELERRTGEGVFERIALLPPDAVFHREARLPGSTLLGYRVRALNPAGTSGYSAEVRITTLGGRLVLPRTTHFGRTAAGTSVTREVRLLNRHPSESLRVTLLPPPRPFTLAGGRQSLEIPPRGRRSVSVGFTPVGPGLQAETLEVLSSDPRRPRSGIRLTGWGL